MRNCRSGSLLWYIVHGVNHTPQRSRSHRSGWSRFHTTLRFFFLPLVVRFNTFPRAFGGFFNCLQSSLLFPGCGDPVIKSSKLRHAICDHPVTLRTISRNSLLLSITLYSKPVVLRLQSLIVNEEAPSPLFLSLCLLFFGRNLALESLQPLLPVIFLRFSLFPRHAIQFILCHPFSFPLMSQATQCLQSLNLRTNRTRRSGYSSTSSRERRQSHPSSTVHCRIP